MLSREFYKLEDLEAKFTDRIYDLESDVERIEEQLKIAKERVRGAREEYRKNELAKIKFDWTRWILD